MELNEYVVDKIDEAIEQGWIEVYFQPVVRAITGSLCGMEALARWNDPHWGMLAPYSFVVPLEENDLIYKLDCYIVKAVCMALHDCMEKGIPLIPTSINFSRLDFLKCDMFEIVEKEVEKYDIPRDFIHIEITESIFVSDEGFLTDVIKKFRSRGYEIWMDDFGSGYSSLNLLKDYDFDMIKMDMKFLSTFTEKSKVIMRSTISMAKDIGIKTLAEGVETLEQLEFLKSIGCERIQGYYYGKPQPLLQMLKQMQEKGIETEERKWRHFYDVAGFHVRDVDIPLEIIEDDGKEFHTLFMNRAYKEQILHTYEEDYAEIDRRVYHTGSPLLEKYREFADVIENSSNIETFYYTDNGNYLRFRAKCLASQDGRHVLKGSIMNISMDQNLNERQMLDGKLRELNLLFDVVDLISVGDNLIAPLLGRFKYITNDSYVYSDLRNAIVIMAKESVYPPESADFIEFMNPDTFKNRIEKSKKGYIEKIFRIKQPDGSYKRKDLIIMMVPGTGANEYILCYKSVPEEIARVLDGLSASARSLVDKYLADSGAITYSEIWENMIWDCTIKFFWKDKDRRFLGASQSFLDFYGFKSLDEILGKTDEDMGWHVSEDPYRNDELKVLKNGEKVIDVAGQCIVGGVIHDIRCQKMPIYRNGEIVGLVGFFEDKDEELYRLENIAIPSNIDHVTGLMNPRAIMICLLDYAEQYVDKKRVYGIIMVKNEKYHRILETYGNDIGEKFLAEMSKKIKAVAGKNCAVGRLKESHFVIITFVKTKQALEYLSQTIKESVESIHDIDGNNITVRVKTTNVLRTEDGIRDDNIFVTAMSEMEK